MDQPHDLLYRTLHETTRPHFGGCQLSPAFLIVKRDTTIMEPAVVSSSRFSSEVEETNTLRFEGTLREFAEFLPRQPTRRHAPAFDAVTTSLGCGPPAEEYTTTLQIDSVTITERSVPYPNEELRDCAAWWNRASQDSSDGFTFSIRELSFKVHQSTLESWSPWVNLITSVLGNLLSLGSVRSLHFSCIDPFRFEAQREIGAPILLGALACCTTLKDLFVEGVNFKRAGMTETLEDLIPHLPLDRLNLSDCSSGIVRAALNPETSRLRSLSLDTTCDVSYSRPLTFLATNQTLQELTLFGSFHFDVVRSLASALKHNRSLQSLTLWTTDTRELRGDWGFGDFGEMLPVNASLESLKLAAPRFLASDLKLFSMGLRQNRTLKSLLLYLTTRGDEMRYVGRGLQPLIEAVRYHNTTLEEVELPNPTWSYSYPIPRVLKFHQKFRSACHALRRGEDVERWLPLLGCTHPRTKASLLFCLARLRAETVAQSLRKWAVVEEDSVATVKDSVEAVGDPPWGETAAQSRTFWRVVSFIAHAITSAAAHLQQRLLHPPQSYPELDRMIAPSGPSWDKVFPWPLGLFPTASTTVDQQSIPAQHGSD